MGLQKWQQNLIFEAVQSARLSPGEFDCDFGADESAFRHRPSGAYFVVGGDVGDYVTRYLAGDSPVEERTGLSQYRLMQQVQLWLAAVKRDIETPDLWGQLQRDADLLGAVSDEDIDNTPFTPAEQAEIAGQLQELGDYVRRTYSPSESQMRLLDERLNYLAAATSRVSRKDWLIMVAGVILGYVLTVALPPEAAVHVLGTLLTNIRHVLAHGPLGLSGG